MPLISKINFFHVHNPRCGGTSINSALYHSDLTNLKDLSYNQCDMENFYGVYRPKGANKVSHEPKILELDHLSISQVLTRLGLEKIRTFAFHQQRRDHGADLYQNTSASVNVTTRDSWTLATHP